MTARDGTSGFTLIEVLISLALFAMIGIAGFSIVDAVLRVQNRTDERLARLAELQRAMHLMTLDFEQVTDGVLTFDGNTVAILRSAPSRSDGVLSVRYDLTGDSLRRTLTGALGAQITEQTLIEEVAALRWLFHARNGGWVETWPPANNIPAGLPTALAAEVELNADAPGLSGTLRRVFRLPAVVTP